MYSTWLFVPIAAIMLFISTPNTHLQATTVSSPKLVAIVIHFDHGDGYRDYDNDYNYDRNYNSYNYDDNDSDYYFDPYQQYDYYTGGNYIYGDYPYYGSYNEGYGGRGGDWHGGRGGGMGHGGHRH